MYEPDTAAPLDIDRWVEESEGQSHEHKIRRVMRVVLVAIADSPELSSIMVAKGGVLLALKYGTQRHTKDIDFSARARVQEVNVGDLVEKLDSALASGVKVDPDVLCRVQSHELRPQREDASFPTLQVRIGYSFRGERQHHRMVAGRNSSNVVLVEVSFNEATCIPSTVQVDGASLIAYSLYDQIAEKYRAIIQQAGTLRDRYRRQDVFDVYAILRKGFLASAEDKHTLLMVMKQKFLARGVPLSREGILSHEVVERAARNYPSLQDEVDHPLPPFFEAIEAVQDYYLGLPWEELEQLELHGCRGE